MPLYDEIALLQEDGEQPAGEQEEQSSESVG
jgi:hypothetical protein